MDISAIGGASGLQAMQQALFKSLDADQDGQVSSTEFEAIGQALPGEGKHGAHKSKGSSGEGFGTETLSAMLSAQENLFSNADADGDGGLTADEIAAGMAANAPAGAAGDTSKMAADLLIRADADGNGSVSADEFKAAAPKGPPPGGGPGAPPSADAAQGEDAASTTNPADTNGDGSVSGAEMLAYLHGAANDASGSLGEDAAKMLQAVLNQLSKYGDDAPAATAKVA